MGREVTWAAAEFQGFRHGYAGTIYKGQGQGQTLDHTYLLHTHHWRAAASYVALTRQRESAQVFVAKDNAKDAHQLARQMGRGEVRGASVAWAAADELRPELWPRQEEQQRGMKAMRQDQAPAAPASARERARDFWDRMAAAGVAARTGRPARVQAQAGQDAPGAGEGWLIPPRVSPDGKDSLGRGAGVGEIAAVVAADKAVQREREARWSYLRGAYRDPHAARAVLDELVKSQGWTSAAARISADPRQLGELRGKEGFLRVLRPARAARQRSARLMRSGRAWSGSAQPKLRRNGPSARVSRRSVWRT